MFPQLGQGVNQTGMSLADLIASLGQTGDAQLNPLAIKAPTVPPAAAGALAGLVQNRPEGQLHPEVQAMMNAAPPPSGPNKVLTDADFENAPVVGEPQFASPKEATTGYPAAKSPPMGAVGGPLGALLGGGDVAPSTGWTMNGQPAAPPSNAQSGPYLSKVAADALLSGGPVMAEWGNRLGPTAGPGSEDKFMTMPGGNRMPVNDPLQEAAANLTFAQQQAGNDPRAFAVLMQQIGDAGNEKFRSAEAAKARGGALDVAKEQSRGHIEAARLASGSQQAGENKQMAAAVAAKKISPEMADAMAPGWRGGPKPTGDGRTVEQVQSAEGRIAALRSPFASLDQNGHPIPVTPTPKMMHDLIDKLDPKEFKAVTDAINRGEFGDKTSVIKALSIATGQNYLMDQGIQDIPKDPNNPNAPSGIPGLVDTGLFSLVRNPSGTMVGRMAENVNKRLSGSPYTHVDIPGYGQVPFDTTDLHGLSAGTNFGIGDNAKRAAKGRLDKGAAILDALLNGGKR